MTVNANYNPDVLTCLANLSSDEVFTPPGIANQVLNRLPPTIWNDSSIRFLDPVSKSGVFLREIVKRLDEGLESSIPDRERRLNHILKNQVFGIAISELTSMLSRRSVYCSKNADGKYSLCAEFDNSSGNIIYENIQHTWNEGRCSYCGASQKEYGRNEVLETHAYQFIHTENLEALFQMKFDVIVGNPPYQLSDGGAAASAMPLYDKFVHQAKKLNPRFISMIIPSRWFSGGKGLDEFRDEMLNDDRLRAIVDYPNSSDCFPGVSIKGGVCYFLWDRDNRGPCEITTVSGANKSIATRKLLEQGFDTLIRYNEAIPIIQKIRSRNEKSFAGLVSARKPFGFSTDFSEITSKPGKDSVKIYANKKTGFVESSLIKQNREWVGKHKVYITMAYGAGEVYPHQILNKPILGEQGSCCTETYLVIGPCSSQKMAKNIVSYIQTKLFRFLVLLNKPTQHATSKVYTFVPQQDFTMPWSDEALYQKYGLSEDEIAFIDSMVRPMGLSDE